MKITTRYHEDPYALHIGTEPPRAYYLPKTPDRRPSVINLNGEWAFHYFDSFLDAVDMDGNVKEPELCPLQVPSCWQCMGWGRHMYTNVRFPIPCDPPYVPEENPCGLYERRFDLKKGESSRYFLNFEGVDSCFYLWVNGEFQGYSQVSHSTSEFEITDKLTDGENVISALVLQWCDGTYLEDQDKLRMSGIFRDVYILERPAAFLKDFFVKESFNDDFSHADITVELTVDGAAQVTGTLFAPDGTELASSGPAADKLCFSVDNPVLWNAENPAQYTLVLSTGDEVIEQKVGLRRIEIKDDVVYLNGVNIKFRGVNRHDSDPVTGYTISREQALRDMLLMKQHNVNAIRTSHYPNAPWFNQLASELGFYVIGEADLESHGFATRYEGRFGKDHLDTYPDAMDDPQFKEAIVDRSQRNVHRDKNNAAVVIWSLGNESGWGENGEAAGRWVKEYDPSRLLHYEGNMTYHKERKPDFSMIDLYSRMYAPTAAQDHPWFKKASIEEYFDGVEIDENWNGRRPPYILCEYIHAMGNGPGDAEDYQQLIMKHDGFVGGFVWEWCDHAVYGGQTPDNRPIYRYGGDHEEFPHDGNFCMDGLVYPDRTPHTGLIEFKNVIRPIRVRKTGENTFILHNYRDFTNANDFAELSFEVMKDGKIIASGKLDMPSIEPHGEAEITVDGLPKDGDSTVTFIYTAKAGVPILELGHPLGFDEIVLSEEKQALPAVAEGKVEISETNRVIAVSGPGFRYELCRQTGLWNQLSYENKSLFTRPMDWNLFRAPLDNDQYLSGKWRESGLDRVTPRVYSIKAENAENGAAVITLEVGIAALIVSPFVKAKVIWTVDAFGHISCSMDCERDMKFGGFLPRFGMRMFLPKAFSEAKYFGYGPFESYSDKHRASRLGIYSSAVKDMTEHYLKPQENGSHYACRWASVTDGCFRLCAASPDTFSVNISNYTQEELTNKKHDYELTPADETIMCLDYKMSGVGSNSCGPVLLEKYQLKEEKFSFTFGLAPSRK